MCSTRNGTRMDENLNPRTHELSTRTHPINSVGEQGLKNTSHHLLIREKFTFGCKHDHSPSLPKSVFIHIQGTGIGGR